MGWYYLWFYGAWAAFCCAGIGVACLILRMANRYAHPCCPWRPELLLSGARAQSAQRAGASGSGRPWGDGPVSPGSHQPALSGVRAGTLPFQ